MIKKSDKSQNMVYRFYPTCHGGKNEAYQEDKRNFFWIKNRFDYQSKTSFGSNQSKKNNKDKNKMHTIFLEKARKGFFFEMAVRILPQIPNWQSNVTNQWWVKKTVLQQPGWWWILKKQKVLHWEQWNIFDWNDFYHAEKESDAKPVWLGIRLIKRRKWFLLETRDFSNKQTNLNKINPSL